MGIGFNSDGMATKIGNSLFKQGCVVAESTKASIAVRAQEGTHATVAIMGMVNGEMDSTAVLLAAGRFLANSTDAVLGGEHSVVIMDGDAVLPDTAVADSFFSGELLFKQFTHIWKRFKIGDETTRFVMLPWMLLAGMKMYVHRSIAELLPAITAWFKFPATGAKTDSAAKCIEFRLIGMRTTLNAGFTLPFDSVRTGGMYVEIGSEFNVLASSAKFFVWSHLRKFVANLLPVTAQLARYNILSAKSTLNGSFA